MNSATFVEVYTETANVMLEEVMITTMMTIIEIFVWQDFNRKWLTDIALFCVVLFSSRENT